MSQQNKKAPVNREQKKVRSERTKDRKKFLQKLKKHKEGQLVGQMGGKFKLPTGGKLLLPQGGKMLNLFMQFTSYVNKKKKAWSKRINKEIQRELRQDPIDVWVEQIKPSAEVRKKRILEHAKKRSKIIGRQKEAFIQLNLEP